jgi:hypothetical protein
MGETAGSRINTVELRFHTDFLQIQAMSDAAPVDAMTGEDGVASAYDHKKPMRNYRDGHCITTRA